MIKKISHYYKKLFSINLIFDFFFFSILFVVGLDAFQYFGEA